MSPGRLSVYFRAHLRRPVTAAAVPVALCCLLAACGGNSPGTANAADTKPGQTVATATANAFTLTGEWPLTGEKLDGSPPDHPIYVVKMDNTSAADPQIGLSAADMVVEELVEGGLTRLAVFYDSDIPDNVGPVRSMRASDVGIVKPAAAEIVASGAFKKTTRIIANHHIPTVTEGSSTTGFYRDDSRPAPYNLFMRLSELAKTAKGAGTPPAAPYLPFGSADDFHPTTSPVRSIAATFSGSQTTTWTHTDAGWVRENSLAQTGDDFVADNVVLLRVRIGNAGYVDPAGNPVPETMLFGKGQAIVVHGDAAETCTWHKKDKASPITLTAADGSAVTVPAGHTWIELVPSQTGSVTLGK